MITSENKMKLLTGMIIGSSLFVTFAAIPASAQTATSSKQAIAQARMTAKISQTITRADKDFTRRITNLTTLGVKIQAMKNVSDTEKLAISSKIQSTIDSLNTLKSKIDADIDLKTIRADITSAIDSTRIYALVIPQGSIEVSADRINTISGLLTTLSTKLQTRITALQKKGKDVTALESTFADIATQVTNAQSKATEAVSLVSGLTPDKGDVATITSNKTAITTAQNYIKAANGYIKIARQDISTILAGIKKTNKKDTATSTDRQ